MNSSPSNIHAYIDGEISADRHAEMTEWLSVHPEEKTQAESYRHQKQLLRAAFDPVLDEPVPERLKLLAKPPQLIRPTKPGFWLLQTWAQKIVASVAIALIGGSVGWFAHDYAAPPQATRMSTLPYQAAIAHVVFSPDVKRPVEIGAEHEDQLVTWLSKRLGTDVRPPKLGTLGYELIGGRLLPGNSGPVAQFMYHDASGQRLTLYVSTENETNKETAFRFAQEGPVNVFYWIDGKFGYAISAGLPKNELARISSSVYDQLQTKQLPTRL